MAALAYQASREGISPHRAERHGHCPRKDQMAILTVHDLVKVYPGGVRAVDGVSFAVEQGEIFGFLGPNGAGKTTTIRVIVTLLAATAGSVEVDGIDVLKQPEKARHRIGYAAQSVGLDDDLTADENLVLQGRLHGLSARAARTKAKDLLGVIDLAGVSHRRVGTFSGGMRKRLDLAQALMHDPPLLFLDEPTTGLDPQNRRALWTYLRDLNNTGVTMFLTTQYLEEADELCGRLAIIDRGQIKVEGSPDSLKESLGGDVVTITLPEGASDELLERAAQALGEVPGGAAATVHDTTVSVVLRDGAERLPGLVRALDSAAVPVARLELAEPTLDDVFLRHTGERLRVDEVRPPSRLPWGRGR
jgi:daunorubicin resistance ABC transporter ATP-binding subunit